MDIELHCLLNFTHCCFESGQWGTPHHTGQGTTQAGQKPPLQSALVRAWHLSLIKLLTLLFELYKQERAWTTHTLRSACSQVDGCRADLSQAKEYYQRYRVCAAHLKLGSLIKDGLPQRFCQQCGRFHLLADFDGTKRCISAPATCLQLLLMAMHAYSCPTRCSLHLMSLQFILYLDPYRVFSVTFCNLKAIIHL